MTRGPQQIPLFGPGAPNETGARPESELRRREPYSPDGLQFTVLGSGSRGNAIVVRSGSQTILVDAGFSCRELERRMRWVGIEPSAVEAMVLTHEHQDHCRGADRFSKRNKVEVYASAGTLSGKRLRRLPGVVRPFRAGAELEVGGFVVRTFGVSHDAREPVGLVLEDSRGWRLGVVADLGSRGDAPFSQLRDLDALVMESNHDLGMLRTGPYPWALKRRIASRWGHLSNEQAASGVEELIGDRLGVVALYHLSQQNNLPALAEAAVGETLDRAGSGARMVATEQTQPTPWLGADGSVTQIPPTQTKAAQTATQNGAIQKPESGARALAPSLPGVT